MIADNFDRHPVDRLAEEFVARYRSGERPTIAEYTGKYPELADELQELLSALALIEEHAPARTAQNESSSRGRLSAPPIPKQFGEYTILRELGRGGMGVVYEAVQQSLGRHVALKVLPVSTLIDPLRLKRFQNEAQAAARLHHTNIVPVFGVGLEAGVHFYAMQFIKGRSLECVLGELKREANAAKSPVAVPSNRRSHFSENERANGAKHVEDRDVAAEDRSTLSASSRQYFSRVAAIGAQVAEALEYAHRQGVMHRDIKPANLLLDEKGTVWIADFGLARCAGQEDLTQTGDLVGTLRYSAPERLRGMGDARTDVYSLGLTLYELLTLRPAFDAADRVALVRQISQDEFPRPRRLDARIPRDLETVVLKAMAADPAARYATAADMAADLRRYLDDKPIAARRVSAVERLWKWCVRRPALAGLAVALLISLCVGLGGVLWQWGRAELNLSEAGRQRVSALREAERAEANYRMARQAVDGLLTTVAGDELLDEPGLQPVRLKLLTRALEYYQEMLATRADDPTARTELAASHLRVAMIKKLTGPIGDAVDSYRNAIDLLNEALSEHPTDRESGLNLVRAYNELSLIQIASREYTAAQGNLEQARQSAERLMEAIPGDGEVQRTLAMTFNNLGFLASNFPEVDSQKRIDDAIALHQQALEIYRQMAARLPGDYKVERSIANTLSNMARRYINARKSPEAQRLYEESLQIRVRLLERNPTSLDMRELVAGNHNALGDVALYSLEKSPSSLKAALVNYEKSLEMQRHMALDNPAVAHYRLEIAGTLANIGQLHAKYDQAERALEWRKKASEEFDWCLARDPINVAYQHRRAMNLAALSDLLQRQERHVEALEAMSRAHQGWRAFREQTSAIAGFRASVRSNQASLMIELGMHDRGADLAAMIVDRCQLAGEGVKEMLTLTYDIERACRALRRGSPLDEKELAEAARNQQMAVETYRKAAAMNPGEAAEYARTRPHLSDYQRLVELDAMLLKNAEDTETLANRYRILMQLGDSTAAQADLDLARRLVKVAIEKKPTDAIAMRRRAGLAYSEHQWESTVADCTRALALRPTDVALLEFRARANMGLRNWQAAYEDFSRILKLKPDLLRHWPERCWSACELGRVDEALSDMNRLLELADKAPKQANSLVWTLLAHRYVSRFPEASLALARRAVERQSSVANRVELGGVQFHLSLYREALNNLQPAVGSRDLETAAKAGFWLAMCRHHLGEREAALKDFQRAVRCWKGNRSLPTEREELLQSLWEESKSLLGSNSQIEASN